MTATVPVASPAVAEGLSDQEQQVRRLALRDLMVATPFIAGLGMVFDRWEPDDVVLRLPCLTGFCCSQLE